MNSLYRLLVVDDEKIIREGLLSFNWEKFGFMAVESAADGEEALQILKDSKIDLVVTDIRMSAVDGLELSHQISKLYPQCKVIILSGYKDFDYAAKAIKAGVMGYLLKPIDFVELENLLIKAKLELDKDTDISNKLEIYEKRMEGDRQLEIKRFLRGLVHEGVVDLSEMEERMNLHEIYLKRQYFACVVYKLKNVARSTRNAEMLSALLHAVNSCMERQRTGYAFMDNDYEMVAVLNFNLARNENSAFDFAAEAVNTSVEMIKGVLAEYGGTGFWTGVGGVYDSIVNVSASYKQAQKVLELSFFDSTGENAVYYSWKEKLAYGQLILEYPYKEEGQLINSILDGNENQTEIQLRLFWEAFNPILKHLEPVRFRIMVIQLINMLERRLNMHGTSIERIAGIVPPFSEYVEAMENIARMKSEIEALLLRAAAYVNEINKKSRSASHNAIQMAIKYINDNYSEKLTLNEIAGKVYLNPSYFSLQFKKETGKNFVEYIKELRVEKAKELLRRVDLKAYEVSEIVGYQDYQYFTDIFKELTGLKPLEYRQKIIAS